MKIKAGDTVVIIAGKDRFQADKKGNVTPKTGKVLKVFPKTNRVLVEGVNFVKKAVKPDQSGKKGGIVTQEAPIHVSNVMLLDPKTNEPTKVGYKLVDGKKVRVAKKSGTVLE